MNNLLTEKQLEQIQLLSEGLSKQDVLDYYGLTLERLSDEDTILFNKAYNRGRVNMKLYAVRALKQAMTNSKTGMAASLAALSQLSEQWSDAPQAAAAKSFTISLNE